MANQQSGLGPWLCEGGRGRKRKGKRGGRKGVNVVRGNGEKKKEEGEGDVRWDAGEENGNRENRIELSAREVENRSKERRGEK